MFGFVAIDVLIGLVTIYLVFALAGTAIVEAISSWMKLRSKNLEAALKELLDGKLDTGKPFIDEFYAHPLVQALSKGPKGRPSYIPADVFGRVVQSLLLKNDPDGSLAKAIESLPDSEAGDQATRVKALFKTFVSQGERDLIKFRNAVENHFDAVMDRASGWVKRRQQTVALIVSAVLVLCANVDTFDIARALYTTPELRAALIARSEQIAAGDAPVAIDAADTTGEANTASAADPDTGAATAGKKAAIGETPGLSDTYGQVRQTMVDTGLPFGWKMLPTGIMEWITKILGLLISTFAIALGAPFWFDLLNRFMKVRQSGVSPNEKKTLPSP